MIESHASRPPCLEVVRNDIIVPNPPEVQHILDHPNVRRVIINTDAYSEMVQFSHTSFETKNETGGRIWGWPCIVKGTDEVIPWIVLATHDEEESTRTTLIIGHKDRRPWEYGFGDRNNPDAITETGSWHSHPKMGVFLSGVDFGNFTKTLKYPWSVQIVIEPYSGHVGALINKGRGKEIPLYIYTENDWEECWQ